jgi:hypothetical protein
VQQVAIKCYVRNIVARRMCHVEIVIRLYGFVNQKGKSTIVRKRWRDSYTALEGFIVIWPRIVANCGQFNGRRVLYFTS